MGWLTENWFWVLIGIVFLGMHLFGHGGHGGKVGKGGHGGCGHGGAEGEEDALATASSEEGKSQAGKSHHH